MAYKTEALNISTPHLKAIAHVSIRSAQLDHMLEFALNALWISSPKQSALILKQIVTAKQVDFLQAALQDYFLNDISDIDSFIAAIKTARSDRNDVIHQVWGQPQEDGTARHASYRPHRKPVESHKTADQVLEIADRLLRCAAICVAIIKVLDSDQRSQLTQKFETQRRRSRFPLVQAAENPDMTASSPPQLPPVQK